MVELAGYEYGSSEARVERFPWGRLKELGSLAVYDFTNFDLAHMPADVVTLPHQHHGRDVAGA